MTLSRKKHPPIYVDLEQSSEKSHQSDNTIRSDDEIQLQTESYNLHIQYSHSKLSISITVFQKESRDTYGIVFAQEKLPLEVAFYQKISYVYLACKISQALKYSIQQKYFEFEDIINNLPKRIRIPLKKTETQSHYQKPKKPLTIQQKLQQAQQQLKLLQSKYQQTQKNLIVLGTLLKQSQQETAQVQKQLKLQKNKVKFLQKDNEQLKIHYYAYKRYFSDSVEQFEFLSKRRKDQEGNCFEVSARNSQVGMISSNVEKHIQELDLSFKVLDSSDSNIIEIDAREFIEALKE